MNILAGFHTYMKLDCRVCKILPLSADFECVATSAACDSSLLRWRWNTSNLIWEELWALGNLVSVQIYHLMKWVKTEVSNHYWFLLRYQSILLSVTCYLMDGYLPRRFAKEASLCWWKIIWQIWFPASLWNVKHFKFIKISVHIFMEMWLLWEEKNFKITKLSYYIKNPKLLNYLGWLGNLICIISVHR